MGAAVRWYKRCKTGRAMTATSGPPKTTTTPTTNAAGTCGTTTKPKVTPRLQLTTSLWAPPLGPCDERPFLAVHAIESTLGVRLEFFPEAYDDTPAPGSPPRSREEALREQARSGSIAFLTTLIAPTRPESQPHVSLYGDLSPIGPGPLAAPMLDVKLAIPEEEPFIERAFDAVAALAEALGATWGSTTTRGCRHPIGMQTVHGHEKNHTVPFGLPALKPPDRLPHALVPHRIAWLNYWCAGTVSRLGSPAARGPGIAAAAVLASGACLWKLTDDPLDLDRAEHLRALLDAYEAFPQVGGRG
jgi:hypothetical protein